MIYRRCIYHERIVFDYCRSCDGRNRDCNDYLTKPQLSRLEIKARERKLRQIRDWNDLIAI